MNIIGMADTNTPKSFIAAIQEIWSNVTPIIGESLSKSFGIDGDVHPNTTPTDKAIKATGK